MCCTHAQNYHITMLLVEFEFHRMLYKFECARARVFDSFSAYEHNPQYCSTYLASLLIPFKLTIEAWTSLVLQSFV